MQFCEDLTTTKAAVRTIEKWRPSESKEGRQSPNLSATSKFARTTVAGLRASAPGGSGCRAHMDITVVSKRITSSFWGAREIFQPVYLQRLTDGESPRENARTGPPPGLPATTHSPAGNGPIAPGTGPTAGLPPTPRPTGRPSPPTPISTGPTGEFSTAGSPLAPIR